MKTYNPKESAEFQATSPKNFEKSYASAKRTLNERIRVFEGHGQGNTASARRLKQALYDLTYSRTESAKSKAFAEATQTLNSARGSYTRSLEVDRKIVRSINARFAEQDEFEGDEYKQFIHLKDLEEFGQIMDEMKANSYDKIFGSTQLILVTREIMGEAKKRQVNWRTIFDEIKEKIERNYKK